MNAQQLSPEDRATLERLEEELWREETRFDAARMAEIVSEDFFEFGRSGRIYLRADMLAIPQQPILAQLPLPNFQLRMLAAGLVQATYDSAVTYDGVVEHARRSSIWSRTPDGWMLRFHQGTPFLK